MLDWSQSRFGLHTPPKRPLASYRRRSGLNWLLRGRPVIALTVSSAAIAGANAMLSTQLKPAWVRSAIVAIRRTSPSAFELDAQARALLSGAPSPHIPEASPPLQAIQQTRAIAAEISQEGGDMSNRPARISQAEIERAIRAARKAGATEVEVKMGDGVSIRIPLGPDRPVAEGEEIVL